MLTKIIVILIIGIIKQCFYFLFFFAPFFLWLCAGWYTLHSLRNMEYFIIFSTHIYIGSISSCFACTQVYQSPLGLWPTAAIRNCICPSNHFLPLKQSSWNLPRYLNLEKSQLKNFAGTVMMHILLNSNDADMKSEIGSSRGGLRPYPLRFHVEEAGADAKLNQHGPLGVAYHRRHPISTVPVARITAHATVPGLL
jgi:hypothetical protein